MMGEKKLFRMIARSTKGYVARLVPSSAPSQQQATLGRSLGPSDPARARLRVLAIADAAGATLQINLIRPVNGAVAAGDVSMLILTEEDERAAVKFGVSGAALIDLAWRQSAPDVVFISRYGGSLAPDILAKAGQTRTPIVYHIDDNLFEVPVEAGIEKARKYGAPGRQEAMRTLLGRASVAYVSTERLAAQLCERIVLAANVFIGEIASASDPLPPRPKDRSKGLQVGYMASSSHAADLHMALPGVLSALTADPDLRFTLFGSLRPPSELASFGARVEHVAAIGDYDSFLQRLAEMNWDWGLAPLRPGRFNEAKTDTKWVEYAAASVPCLVSDHPVYRDCTENGAAVAVGDEDWTEALPRVLADRGLAVQTAAAAHVRLVRKHGLGRMARQLYSVFVRAGVPAPRAAAISDGC